MLKVNLKIGDRPTLVRDVLVGVAPGAEVAIVGPRDAAGILR